MVAWTPQQRKTAQQTMHNGHSDNSSQYKKNYSKSTDTPDIISHSSIVAKISILK